MAELNQLTLGIGTRLQHTQFGPGVIVGIKYATYLISFINHGIKEIDKADQIDLLNKSVHYFSKKESFNVKEFETEVIEKPEYVEAFKMYKEDYAERHQIPSYDEFDISPAAVK
ncbi:MAG: hypothetical protein EOP48_26055, partial [Sphingobacteriales bacterium]